MDSAPVSLSAVQCAKSIDGLHCWHTTSLLRGAEMVVGRHRCCWCATEESYSFRPVALPTLPHGHYKPSEVHRG